MTAKQNDSVVDALNAFQIELPSWGFANTGTRFGKFLQAGAAATLEEKFSDAGQVHHWTGVCPAVALHVLWDLPAGTGIAGEVRVLGLSSPGESGGAREVIAPGGAGGAGGATRLSQDRSPANVDTSCHPPVQ